MKSEVFVNKQFYHALEHLEAYWMFYHIFYPLAHSDENGTRKTNVYFVFINYVFLDISIHRPGLWNQHSKSEKKRQDIPGRSSRELFSSRIWNGKNMLHGENLKSTKFNWIRNAWSAIYLEYAIK